MQSLPMESGRNILIALVTAIQEHAAYLSELDGAIGDGDHGVNMSKGFASFQKKLPAGDISLSDGLSLLGTTLMTEIGGAMGPLYGTFFMTMGNACSGSTAVNGELFAEMLKAAVDEVQDLGGAQVGDKTLIDTLVPAQASYAQAIADGLDFTDALQKMASAAETGCQSTRTMVAKLGRASRLGARSSGHLDAGATSCALILTTMAAAITTELS
jgi:phosphoenolpyruvate---glycerone phosphotransferase subunit DhaL